MKLLILLLSIVVTHKSCNESKLNQEKLSMEYVVSSRGIYKKIKINNKTVYTINERGGNPIEKECTNTDWNKLLTPLKGFEIEQIPDLEPPSKKHQFDGAAMARLIITSKGKTYETQPFDHGNPPDEIAELIDKMVSITENIE